MNTKTTTGKPASASNAPPLNSPPPPPVNHDAKAKDEPQGVRGAVALPDGVYAGDLPQQGSMAGASPYDPPGVGAGPSVDAVKAHNRNEERRKAREKADEELAAKDEEISRSPFTPAKNPGDVPQTRGTAGDPNDGGDHGGGKPTEQK